jgi:hypothetical protein
MDLQLLIEQYLFAGNLPTLKILLKSLVSVTSKAHKISDLPPVAL